MYGQFKHDVGREKMKIKKLKKKNYVILLLLNDVVKIFIILLWQFQQVLIRF